MGWVRACPAEGLPRCTSLILTRAYHHCSSKKCVRVQRPLPCGSLRPELWEGDSPTARAPGLPALDSRSLGAASPPRREIEPPTTGLADAPTLGFVASSRLAVMRVTRDLRGKLGGLS